MLDYPHEIRDGDKERIKNALIVAIGDPEHFVRKSAVEGLGKLRDPSLAPLLDQIARSDPYQRGDGVYPVRDAARKAQQGRGK